MFKCFICQSLHFTSQALISHLRLGHSFYPSTKFKLACSQDGCRRQSTTYSGLKKHLNSAHDKDSCQSGDVEMSESFQADFDSLQDTIEVEGTRVMQSPEAGCSENNGSGQCIGDNTKHICATIISRLNGSGVANSVVSAIVGDLEDFADGLHSQFKQKVLSTVPMDNPVRSTLENCLETFENPVQSFDTETKRKKYLSEKWGIVDPLEKILGVRHDTRLNKNTSTYDPSESPSERHFCVHSNFGNNKIHLSQFIYL